MLCNEPSIECAELSGAEPMRSRQTDWRTVDRALRGIAMRRAGLDAEELHWLREAEALQIWRPLGMVSGRDYPERVFGYTPRVAEERLRVARALGDLPRLGEELASGQLPFSAVRELTRVVTPDTEADWIAAAAGKTVRQIEDLVSGHRLGDRPDDAPDPEARTHVVRFELAASTFAQLRQARQVLDDEHGRRLSDDELIAALSDTVLDDTPATEPTGRAKFQIAVTVCERCKQGWQEGAGKTIPIDTAAVERARCDAQHIGSLDGDGPERAHQDVPPSTVRFIWRRDGGRCRVPGCRSARALEIHHLVHRADGGGHEASNLALLCSSCHLAHHRGALVISGTADQLVVHRPGVAAQAGDRNPHVGANSALLSAETRDTHAQLRHQTPQAMMPNPHVGATSALRPAENRDTHVQLRHQAPPANSHAPHVGATSALRPAQNRDTHVQVRHQTPLAMMPNPHVG